MTGQLSALAQGKAAGTTGYTSKLLKTGQTTQYDSELDDGYYEVGVAKSYTVNTTGAQSGTTNVDLTHLVSDTGAFTAANKTYTDAGKCGVFKAAGGETVIISGSASNNGTFTTASATADTVVFVETIVNEADAPATTFKKREAISNNTVLDNNTGLTWLRNECLLLGPLGTGYMPLTGTVYDAYQFCAVCNAASLGGHTDWRIPNVQEFISVISYETLLMENTTAFPSISSTRKWTSTTLAGASTTAIVYRMVNNFAPLAKSTETASGARTMLVRGGTA